jgi:CheY-like chemotaxis protein
MIPEARILVADDDQSIRQLLGTIIEREGFHVDTVADGNEAIEKLKAHQYEVVLLDLMMPRRDGFEVIEYLKHHPGPIKPVVLVISAYADQRFKQVDPDIVAGVIRKPFEVAELGSMIRLCVKGLDEELSQKLYYSSDRSVREFAEKYGPDRSDS